MNITFTITQIELSWILFALLALVTVPENHNRLVTEVYLQGNCDLGQPPQGWMVFDFWSSPLFQRFTRDFKNTMPPWMVNIDVLYSI